MLSTRAVPASCSISIPCIYKSLLSGLHFSHWSNESTETDASLCADSFLSVLHTVSAYCVPRKGKMTQDRKEYVNSILQTLTQTMQPKCIQKPTLQCRAKNQKGDWESVRHGEGLVEMWWRTEVRHQPTLESFLGLHPWARGH